MKVPRIGITLGDPGGIGPEVVVKALGGRDFLPPAHYIVYGSSKVLEEELKSLNVKIEFHPVSKEKDLDAPRIFFHDVGTPLKTIWKGSPSAENGRASFLYFNEGFEDARNGRIQALVTAPISKASWALAGIEGRGHTDYINRSYPQAIMAFWSKRLKVALLSHHLPLKQALEKVREESLLNFFLLLHQIVEKMNPGKYEFLVAGLNPHAGEDGLLGREERDEIRPAIESARCRGIKISGPYPPDTVFRNARDQADKIVIALYHDQGLIAFKLDSFETGVNVTLGLPFIRTSPDHGTAFDITGMNKADARSLVEAVKLAFELTPSRRTV